VSVLRRVRRLCRIAGLRGTAGACSAAFDAVVRGEVFGEMASRQASGMGALLGKATGDGDAKKLVAVGAALGTGALAAKVVRDRLSSREGQRRFRLRDGEPVSDGIERIACGQLDLSIERLDGRTDEDLGTAVHEARKSFKRLRATVRLARDELGDDVYRRENTAFRDAGRRLAGTRDSQVVLETLDALSERYPSEAPRAGFVGFRKTLAGERREPSSENLHELRKRVKDLWYAARIVRPASPKRMKGLARAAHELSDLIGEEHDLAILEGRASERRDRFDDERTLGELGTLIERRRDELRREAVSLGARLFRKKPRKVARPLANSRTAA